MENVYIYTYIHIYIYITYQYHAILLYDKRRASGDFGISESPGTNPHRQ